MSVAAQGSSDRPKENHSERFDFPLPDFQKLGSRLEELIKEHQQDPAIPGLLLEALMSAEVVGRNDVSTRMASILYLKYPQTLQAAYLRKNGGWESLFDIFRDRISSLEKPIEPADVAEMKRVMATMIKENGVDWTNETILFYASIFGYPAGDETNLANLLRSRNSPTSRATRILREKGLSVQDKIVDLSEFRAEPALRGLERYYYKFELKAENRQSKLVTMALARGYLEQRDYAKATELLVRLAEKMKDPDVRFYLAWALAKEGKWKEAKQAIEELDSKNLPASTKEHAEKLLEAFSDHKDAGLAIRAGLTRTFAKISSGIPRSFGVCIRMPNTAKGDRTLMFRCDTASDRFSVAYMSKEKPIFLYKSFEDGSRIFFDDDRDIRESATLGIVPSFSIAPQNGEYHFRYETSYQGSHVTTSALEKTFQQKWFVPALLADYCGRMMDQLGWLALAPEDDEDEETYAWVRPNLVGTTLERFEIRLNGKGWPKSYGYVGHFQVEFLNFEEGSQVKDPIEPLWPKLPIVRTLNNHSDADWKRLFSSIAEIQNLGRE